jgi:hypothetical protein
MLVLVAVDWPAVASMATAGATLVLAVATFSSVRSANRTARAAEQSLLAGLAPVLSSSRLDDPEQKYLFMDDNKVLVPAGGPAAVVGGGPNYLAISVRNVGHGLAVLDRWAFAPERLRGPEGHRDPGEFHRLTRDLYIPPGEVGFWQGAFRDPADPSFAAASEALLTRQPVTVDLLYGDHLGAQRTVTRFVLLPRLDDKWFVSVSRHWYLDRPDPR